MIESKGHGVEGGLEDVALIDLGSIDDANADGKGLLVDLIEECAADCFGKALGVVQFGQIARRREQDSGCDNRPGKRASARFVDSCDAMETLLCEFFFHPARRGKQRGLLGGALGHLDLWG